MLKRLLVGIVIGILVGGLLAAGIVKLFGVTFALTGGAVLAYAAALLTGALVGLVAGKPVWAKGAWIEVGLKAFVGAVLAAGIMFVLRRWVDVSVNLVSFGAGTGALGELPAASLPIIATLLSVFYELDNTDSGEGGAKDDVKPKRVGAGKDGHARIADDEAEAEEQEPAPTKKRATK
jgi:hypothetical protein